MNNIKDHHKQKQMPWFAFKMMTLIMNIRKKFRNIDEEVGLAGIESGMKILDFGCGLGFNTIPAAKIVGAEGRVFALDISKQAINIVKKKAIKSKLENIETIHSDCNTNLKNKSIDVVYLHNTLPLVNDKQKVLEEIAHVLKKGGRLSYMSRAVSRLYGDDNINDLRLKEILKSDYRLIKEIKGHLVFERN